MVVLVGLSLVLPATAYGAEDSEDKFGIEKLYPTDGRTWYMDDDSVGDLFNSEFRLLTDEKITERSDGVFHLDVTDQPSMHGLRFHVTTPEGEEEWKDVEMTGYFKVLDNSRDEHISMITRGGRHSDDTRCDATGYFGKVGFDGDVRIQKKLSHGNYADSVAKEKGAVDDLEGQWIGIKTVVYNVNKDHDVKMELWVDESNEGNHWKKVTEYTDDGGWKGGGACGRDSDEILNDAREWVSFRIDSAELLFKNLSVREINP